MPTIFKTKRLYFRPFELSDAAEMYALNADPDVIRYTGNAPFESINAAKAFLQNYTDYARNGYGRWAVIRQSDSAWLGWCGLKLNEDGFTDIGFRFHKKHWNKGYATEAASATLEYGFQELNISQIIGKAAQDNLASIKVLEKIGMQYWKTKKSDGLGLSHFYSIIAPQK